MKTPREQFLEDVLVTAVEGGIGYWAEVAEYRYRDCHAVIAEREDATGEGPRRFTLSAAKLEEGLARVASPEFKINARQRGEILSDSATNGEACLIDADSADCIVQAAVFGELVYG